MQYGQLEDFISGLPPEMQSQEFRNKPELEGWQRDILNAFYTLARGRQSGFDVNPISLADMAAMIALNQSVSVYEPLDLIDLWQELDATMRQYWADRKAADEKLKAALQEKAGKKDGQELKTPGDGG